MPQPAHKYLIQMETGRIYGWSQYLAVRPDMAPYDEKTFGEPNAEGKSPVLSKKADADEGDEKKDKDEEKDDAKNHKGAAKK